MQRPSPSHDFYETCIKAVVTVTCLVLALFGVVASCAECGQHHKALYTNARIKQIETHDTIRYVFTTRGVFYILDGRCAGCARRALDIHNHLDIGACFDIVGVHSWMCHQYPCIANLPQRRECK